LKTIEHVETEPEIPAPPLAIRRRASRPRRGPGKRSLIALALIVAVLAGLAGGGFFAYTSVRRDANQLQAQLTTHLELGQRELEAAKNSLKQANTTHDDKLIAQAKAHFINAKLQFLTARQIADSSELLSRIENLPSVGQLASSRHVAVDDIAGMGIHLSQAGLELADLDALLIKPPAGGQQGQGLLTMINQVKVKIDPIRAELSSALKAADAIDLSVLPSGQKATFLRARGTIGQGLAAIDQFKSLVPMIIEILGGNGPRTYLIEQVNPAELRPGGGFIGGYSVLQADHGKLELTRTGSGPEWYLPVRCKLGMSCYVEPPGPYRQWLSDLGWTFVDSNFFPDFPTNAQAGMQLARSKLGQLDGVIAIDYYAVAKMLEVTGPLAVPGYNMTLDANNFIPTIVKYDIEASLSWSTTDSNPAILHRAILEAASRPLVDRITKLQSGSWPLLINALNDLAASKHMQVYFRNSDVQKNIDQFGWSAAMRNAGMTDYLMETEANLGGTKANYYVTRHHTLELTREGGILHHKLTVDVLDDMPYAYRPNEYYQAFMRLFISDKTTGKSVDIASRCLSCGGPVYPPPAPPRGTQAMGGWIFMHGYGHNRVVQFDWDTPWLSNNRGEEQIYWQKQPGTVTDKVDVIWNDGRSHTFKTSGDLGQDRVVTLGSRAVTLTPGQLGSFQFPSLSLG
jgi:hypothetical protein